MFVCDVFHLVCAFICVSVCDAFHSLDLLYYVRSSALAKACEAVSQTGHGPRLSGLLHGVHMYCNLSSLLSLPLLTLFPLLSHSLHPPLLVLFSPPSPSPSLLSLPPSSSSLPSSPSLPPSSSSHSGVTATAKDYGH